ncbi:MAG TPA: T9SS type A sorting domain-containing protein [Crocinitomicaceae bacterium]|nr:T9SS type A sorting domain-containing protein [Crocinitomicaceae bacterium]
MKTITILISLIISSVSFGQTFAEEVLYNVSSQSSNSGDMDGDGDIDFVYISEQFASGPLSELLIKEKLFVNGIPSYNLITVDQFQNPNSRIKVFDIDNDNDLDIVCTGTLDTIFIFENQGLYNFTKKHIAINGTVADVQFGDFNNDNLVDLIYIETSTNSVRILQQIGGLNFVNNPITSTFLMPTKIRLFDVDNNGLQDFMVTGIDEQTGSGQVKLFTNNGGGNFTSSGVNASPAYDVFPIDIDGDSDLDFLTANIVNGQFAYWLNNGSNYFTKTIFHTLGSAYGASVIRAKDMDNDGDIDIVTGDVGSGGILLFRNTGGLNFVMDTISPQNQTSGLKIFDEDADGDNDVLSSSTTKGVSVFRNKTIILGINEIDGQVSFEIAPNPSNEIVTVKIDESLNISNAKIVLIDINGQEVYSKEVVDYSTLINVSKLNAGTYFIKVALKNSISTEKIEVIK